MHNLNSDLKFKNQIKFNSFCLQFDVVKRIKKRIPENKAKRNLDQHAKKVVSDNPGLVDFVIRLVNSVLILPDRQVKFFLRNSNDRITVKSVLLIKEFLGLVEMTFGQVHGGLSLPKWQAVKMTFSAPCCINN